MPVQVINSLSDFQNIITQNKLVALDAWAEWCGPCRTISPIFEKFSTLFPDITFVKVDVDQVPEVSQELGVRAMPTFFFFENGVKVNDVVGANPPALESAVTRLNSLA